MKSFFFILLLLIPNLYAAADLAQPQIIQFQNGSLTLHGELFLPKGKGPFPVVLYNHGSAPGMINSEASKTLAPLFTSKGWIFFMPYRRGQGLSADAGKYIGDEIENARKAGGETAAATKMVALLKGDHLSDQLAALKWLREQKFVQKNRIAVAGNSFGGIQTVLGASKETYCAAIDAAGGAESWEKAPALQTLMKDSVRDSKSPIFFFQAENDYDLSPSRILSIEMKAVGKPYELKIYPAFGKTNKDGHSFPYAGNSVWFNDVFTFIDKNCSR
jgi:carboxymethylenebutenolidase